jgi:hypothetical protein
MHISDDQNRLGFVNPTQINQLELNTVINEKSEMFKDMRNNKRATEIKKAQQKLTKEKRDLASTHIGQLIQRFEDGECIMAHYNINMFVCLYSRHWILAMICPKISWILYWILFMSMNLSTRNSSSVFNGNISTYHKSYYHYSY